MAATNVVSVVVHSFVADSSLLDCCDLVVFFPPYGAGRPPFAFLRWFQLFACLIRAALFRLPSTFVVWSFFAMGSCGLFFLLFFFFYRHLCTVSFLHGLFCCRHSC